MQPIFISDSNFEKTELIPHSSSIHSPIYINGNDELDSFFAGNASDGTKSNPFVFENLVISAEQVNGIMIENTNKYIEIKNSTIIGLDQSYPDGGIKIVNSSNIKIINNTVQDFILGYVLWRIINASVLSNIAFDNVVGISLSSYMEGTIGNSIQNNNLYDNTIGLGLQDINNTLVTNNTLFSNEQGFFIGTAYNNLIYLNNFINNTETDIKISTEGSGINFWDNGSIGNYYSDYAIRYPLSFNDENVWKTPYQIGNSSDNFPVCYPFDYEKKPLAKATPIITKIGEDLWNVNFTFSGLNGNPPLSYQWDFEDGSPNSTERNPIHSYSIPGYYNISLTVTDNKGYTDVFRGENIIDLHNKIPEANFYANITSVYLHNNEIEFYFNGTEGDEPVSFQWDFGDGTSNSTEHNPIHKFNQSGTYSITLTINDTDSEISTMRRIDYIELTNLVPSIDIFANFTTGYLTDNPFLFNFYGSGGDQPLSFQWNFGDGTENSTEKNPSHEYLMPGIFTISLTISDMSGDTLTMTIENYITIINLLPVSDFTFEIENSIAQFSFSGDLGDQPATLQWDFGDGTGNSTELNPEHIYRVSGTFTVILTVTDINGDTDIIIKTNLISIEPSSPSILGYNFIFLSILFSLGVCLIIVKHKISK